MNDLPVGMLADYNVGDYLDEEERAALATGGDVLGSLLSGFPGQAGINISEDDGTSRMDLPTIDDEVVISESDLDLDMDMEGAEEDEEGKDGVDGESDMEEDTSESEADSPKIEESKPPVKGYNLPVLGKGEHQERIFRLSEIFSGKGVKHFFPEYEEEDVKIEDRNQKLLERIKQRRELPEKPPELHDEAKIWTDLQLDEEAVFEYPPTPVASPGSSLDSRKHGKRKNRIRSRNEDDLRATSNDNASESSSGMDDISSEFLLGNLLRWEDDIIYDMEDLEKAKSRDKRKQEEGDNDDPLKWTCNPHLMSDDWMKNIMWSSRDRPPSPHLLWDLNDPHMRFQLQEGANGKIAQNAAATVIPPNQHKNNVKGVQGGGNDLCEALGYFSISKDDYYCKEQTGGQDGVGEGVASPHAVPALTLSTLPLHTADQELREFHRSKSFWMSASDLGASRNSNSSNHVEIMFKSVTGRTATVVRSSEESDDATIGHLFDQVKVKGFPDAGRVNPIFLTGQDLRPISVDTTLRGMGLGEAANHIVVWVVFQDVQLLPVSASQLPKPDSKTPLRPPGAFGKRKDLTGMDGHLLLLEYMEENPLLFAYPGMGFTIRTWHRQRDREDTDGALLAEDVAAGERWTVGAVKSISRDDPSPFIGTLEEGASRLSVEAPMFRSIASPMDAPPTDFLLIRSAAGALSLREITGTLAVGQQQPLVKIPQPATSALKDFEERRLVAYACRKLRQKSHKSSKPAEVSVDELLGLFPLTETVIKARLKDRCSCIPKRGEDGSFTLKPGASLHSEHELRQILSPEDVCAFDSTRSLKAHLTGLGIRYPEKLMSMSVEKWKLAIDMLPEKKKHMARHLLEVIQTAPWAQSDGYLAWKQGKSQVSVAGPGDVSGRGLTCSFMKEPIRKAEEGRPAVRQPTGITGTGADLRKLGAEEAVRALQGLPEQFHSGINFDELKKFDRWEIIKYVRNIATAAVKDGVELSPDLAKFARHGRSTQQVAAGLKRKAEEVFRRQLNLLDGEDVECEAISGNASELISANSMPAKVRNAPGTRRIRRIIVNPDGSERRVFLPMERYNQIVWGGKNLANQKKRIIEGRRPLPVIVEDPVKRPVSRKAAPKRPQPQSANRSKVTCSRKSGTAKRPSTEEVDDLAVKLKITMKKPRTTKGVARKIDAAGKQKTPVKKTPAKRQPPKRKPSARVMARVKTEPPIDIPPPVEFAPVEFPEPTHPDPPLEMDSELPGHIASIPVPTAEAPDRPQPAMFTVSTAPAVMVPPVTHITPPITRQVSLPATSCRKGKTFKTKDGRRMTGRKVLNNKVLTKVLSAINKYEHSKWLKHQVNKSRAPDYSKFVKASDEMWLEKISKKVKGLKYCTAEAFREDIEQIRANAVAYNSPGKGAFGGEIFITCAEALLKICNEELATHQDQIEEEEERIRQEDMEKERQKSSSVKLEDLEV
ncbi:hypothetical protein BSKO_08502 [Bryopsis sp. KO-2023]|nr:hypothetical protein BSKO_08502 [Bryopsis sp. KO-2023]